jgi:hypothetical protein
MRRSKIFAMAAALALGGLTILGPARPLALAQATDQASSLGELAERLLAPPEPGPAGQGQTVQLLPEQLPSELPLEVPLPTGSRLVGSAARGSGGTSLGTDVVLDAPASAAQVLAFYQHELAARGWTAPPGGTGGAHGFQGSVGPAGGAFCGPAGAGSAWLFLNVFARAGTPSDVRLHIENARSGPCTQPREPPPQPPNAELLPALYAPEGVALEAAGAGGGPNRWTTEATAESDRSVAELEAHFAQQLAAAGWLRQAGAAQGPLAWSTWTLPGNGDWSGFLYVLEGPAQNKRTLSVRLESATAQPLGSYGVSQAPAVAPPSLLVEPSRVGPPTPIR